MENSQIGMNGSLSQGMPYGGGYMMSGQYVPMQPQLPFQQQEVPSYYHSAGYWHPSGFKNTDIPPQMMSNGLSVSQSHGYMLPPSESGVQPWNNGYMNGNVNYPPPQPSFGISGGFGESSGNAFQQDILSNLGSVMAIVENLAKAIQSQSQTAPKDEPRGRSEVRSGHKASRGGERREGTSKKAPKAAPKETMQSIPSKVPPQKRGGDWICPRSSCRNLNFERRDLCNKCGEPCPMDARKTERRGVVERQWKCSGCQMINYPHRVACFRCDEPRREKRRRRSRARRRNRRQAKPVPRDDGANKEWGKADRDWSVSSSRSRSRSRSDDPFVSNFLSMADAL
eukprot:TRINITY_DN7643_c0_g2_i2.p1 TRINITY_DN7643_c0_g2~~TRINITY_DN7643_c0_g2_i2.p1  ORF type:complete len:340 (-),score=14.17 TRINITY_DN7643_c0_g2_i2:153-1172(-)